MLPDAGVRGGSPGLSFLFRAPKRPRGKGWGSTDPPPCAVGNIAVRNTRGWVRVTTRKKQSDAPTDSSQMSLLPRQSACQSQIRCEYGYVCTAVRVAHALAHAWVQYSPRHRFPRRRKAEGQHLKPFHNSTNPTSSILQASSHIQPFKTNVMSKAALMSQPTTTHSQPFLNQSPDKSQTADARSVALCSARCEKNDRKRNSNV